MLANQIYCNCIVLEGGWHIVPKSDWHLCHTVKVLLFLTMFMICCVTVMLVSYSVL